MIGSYVKGIIKDTNETVTGYLVECPDKLPEEMHDKKDVNIRSFVIVPNGTKSCFCQKNKTDGLTQVLTNDTVIYEIDSDSVEYVGFFNTYAGSYHPIGVVGE